MHTKLISHPELHDLIMAFLHRKQTSLLFIILLVLVQTFSAAPPPPKGMMTSTSSANSSTGTSISIISTATASTMAAVPTSGPMPAMAGRCEFKDWHSGTMPSWGCAAKGFECLQDKVCVDNRTPGQKIADKQDAADGKDGCCLFNPQTQGYGCAKRGFRCIDEEKCVDERTPKERKEDAANEARRLQKWKTSRLAGAVVGSVVAGCLLLSIAQCFIRQRWPKPVVSGAVLRAEVEREVGRQRRDFLPYDRSALRGAVELEVRRQRGTMVVAALAATDENNGGPAAPPPNYTA